MIRDIIRLIKNDNAAFKEEFFAKCFQVLLNRLHIHHDERLSHSSLERMRPLFNSLPNELIAFFISKSMSLEIINIHKVVIFLLDDAVLQMYIPGILSFNLQILSNQEACESRKKCLEIITLILSKSIKIDQVGLDMLYNVVKHMPYVDIQDISKYCRSLFTNEKKLFFLLNLIRNDCTLTNDEYGVACKHIDATLSDNAHALLQDEEACIILQKLSDQGVYRVSRRAWSNLVNLHNDTKNVSRYIEIIQRNEMLDNYVVEYMPLEERKVEVVLKQGRMSDLIVLFNRIRKPLCKLYVLKTYIKYKELESAILVHYNVKEMAKTFEHEIFEWLYFKLDNIKKKHIKFLNNALQKANYVTISTFEDEMTDYLTHCVRYSELSADTSNLVIVRELLSIVHILQNPLNVIKILDLLQKHTNVKKEELTQIFGQILYLDLDSISLRNKKYEIIIQIIAALFEKNYKMRYQPHLPLLANLWDEISIIPEEGEMVVILRLINTIIEHTGNFYKQRLFSSSIFMFFLNMVVYSSNTNIKNNNTVYGRLDKRDRSIIDKDYLEPRKRATVELQFITLLETCIDKRILPRNLFSKTWLICYNYYNHYDLRSFAKKLMIYDKYLSFYVLIVEMEIDKASNIARLFAAYLQECA